MQNWMSPTLAFSTLVGPPAAFEALWSKIVPVTSSLSSKVPPSLQTTLMSFRSNLHHARSKFDPRQDLICHAGSHDKPAQAWRSGQ